VVTAAAGLDIGPGAKATSRKLAASREQIEDLLSDVSAVMEVLGLKLADHSQHKGMITALQWALLEGIQVTAEYRSPYRLSAAKLTLHPYRLCLAGQAWYLIGRSTQDDRPKTYRAQRFTT